MKTIELTLDIQIFRANLEKLMNKPINDIDHLIWLYDKNLSPELTFDLYIYLPF